MWQNWCLLFVTRTYLFTHVWRVSVENLSVIIQCQCSFRKLLNTLKEYFNFFISVIFLIMPWVFLFCSKLHNYCTIVCKYDQFYTTNCKTTDTPLTLTLYWFCYVWINLYLVFSVDFILTIMNTSASSKGTSFYYKIIWKVEITLPGMNATQSQMHNRIITKSFIVHSSIIHLKIQKYYKILPWPTPCTISKLLTPTNSFVVSLYTHSPLVNI